MLVSDKLEKILYCTMQPKLFVNFNTINGMNGWVIWNIYNELLELIMQYPDYVSVKNKYIKHIQSKI